jgi:hypothetical protein
MTDEGERDAAAGDDGALVRYQRKWERKLAHLQRVYPQRWRVAGLSDEEVRDALTLRLLEAVRTGADEPGRPGQDWGLTVMQRHLAVLRKRFRLAATPTDFDAAPTAQRAPTQEELWLEVEAAGRRALAREQAESGLTRPQRRWLAALEDAARDGDFFAASDEPNLSAASRLLGKNRSSAQRAYRNLQRQFLRARDRTG